MDAFVTRTKRKRDGTPERSKNAATHCTASADADDADDTPTEVRLALLASQLATDVVADPDVLLDVLLAHGGSVTAAAEAVHKDRQAERQADRQADRYAGPKRPRTVDRQTSLGGYGLDGESPQRTAGSLPTTTPRILFDPADVAALTPCSLLHNILPAATADALLREMLDEAATFAMPHFQMFDQPASSPHTSGFFVDSPDSLDGETPNTSHPVDSDYRYNGAPVDLRRTTPQLTAVRPLIEAAVNAAMAARGGLPTPRGDGPWRSNAALVNCYRGPRQAVGWHSDQLTYLGPRPIIGSLSLGVARAFRIRRVVPSDDPEPHRRASAPFHIHLPHNSLLVMHAGMQETWKHCVAPAPAIDPHPVAGLCRINITYRYYRPDFHPRHIPPCHCRQPTVLRVVQKKCASFGRYFWMCSAGNVVGQQGCSFFQWAVFDSHGRPQQPRPQPPLGNNKIG